MKSLLVQILAASIWLALLLPCHAGKIHDAVAKRDLTTLDRALKQEPKQINAKCYPDFKTPLYMAVAAGDPAMVKRLLDAGADPKMRGVGLPATPVQRALYLASEDQMAKYIDLKRGILPETPADTRNATLRQLDAILAAVPDAEKKARLEVLTILLSGKPDLNMDFKGTIRPLHIAASIGNQDLLRMLITSGAKVDVQEDLLRNTPLHVAVENQPPREAIDVLIAAGADVNASNKDGVTPLMLAARAGSAAAVDALLSHQAVTDAEDLKGRPVISYAADGGNDDIVKQIFQTGGRNIIRTADKGGLLLAAATGGSMALTEILLAEGVDINVRDEEGFTPLLTAVESNHKELSEYLILKGSNLKAKSKDGRDLFEVACRAGNIALAKKLLDDGHASKRRPSLLSDVALSGHVESVEYLLTDESDVNFRGEDGSTPLTITICASQIRNQLVTKHPASEDDYARIVELLLEHGAKVDQINALGLTAVHLAAVNGSARIMKALLKAGGNPTRPSPMTRMSPLQTAAPYGKAETVRVLLDAGANLKEVSREGDTLLHFATIRGNAPVVKLLLGKHLDVNAKNKRDGATPLHYAAAANSLECVELLLNAGASPNALDSNHANPLVAAVNLKGCLEILESDRTKAADGLRQVALDQLSRLRIIYLLLQAGAATNMNIKDSPIARQVFLRYARDVGTPEIVELLENPPPIKRTPR